MEDGGESRECIPSSSLCYSILSWQIYHEVWKKKKIAKAIEDVDKELGMHKHAAQKKAFKEKEKKAAKEEAKKQQQLQAGTKRSKP